MAILLGTGDITLLMVQVIKHFFKGEFHRFFLISDPIDLYFLKVL